ncbi:hypothetical protein C2G38_2222324 [Gigaspora rosea]|uniref:Uncharacterized protein n=1 Tax=Gigaspora rosea TaxID=44941 RepID=A0A397U2K6_9GLOM|nr:hypothetical protein C2G38_2222324 [Gigaspora rosea]
MTGHSEVISGHLQNRQMTRKYIEELTQEYIYLYEQLDYKEKYKIKEKNKYSRNEEITRKLIKYINILKEDLPPGENPDPDTTRTITLVEAYKNLEYLFLFKRAIVINETIKNKNLAKITRQRKYLIQIRKIVEFYIEESDLVEYWLKLNIEELLKLEQKPNRNKQEESLAIKLITLTSLLDKLKELYDTYYLLSIVDLELKELTEKEIIENQKGYLDLIWKRALVKEQEKQRNIYNNFLDNIQAQIEGIKKRLLAESPEFSRNKYIFREKESYELAYSEINKISQEVIDETKKVRKLKAEKEKLEEAKNKIINRILSEKPIEKPKNQDLIQLKPEYLVETKYIKKNKRKEPIESLYKSLEKLKSDLKLQSSYLKFLEELYEKQVGIWIANQYVIVETYEKLEKYYEQYWERESISILEQPLQ